MQPFLQRRAHIHHPRSQASLEAKKHRVRLGSTFQPLQKRQTEHTRRHKNGIVGIPSVLSQPFGPHVQYLRGGTVIGVSATPNVSSTEGIEALLLEYLQLLMLAVQRGTNDSRSYGVHPIGIEATQTQIYPEINSFGNLLLKINTIMFRGTQQRQTSARHLGLIVFCSNRPTDDRRSRHGKTEAE